MQIEFARRDTTASAEQPNFDASPGIFNKDPTYSPVQRDKVKPVVLRHYFRGPDCSEAGELDFRVTNVMATAHLMAPINLRDVAQRLNNAEYKPRRFPAVNISLRVQDLKATVFVYASGRISVMGSKSEEHAKLAARAVAKMIKKSVNPCVKFVDFHICNIIAHAQFGFEVSFEHYVARHFKSGASYDPEVYSGLI